MNRIPTAVLLVFALLAGGCRGMQASPVAPSTVVAPATPVQTTPPLVTGPPFSIQIGSNGGQAFTDAQWSTSVTVSGRSAPTRVTVNCNNGAPLQEYAGFNGTQVIACAFPLEGAYPVVATALGANGFAVSDRTDVTASVRPAVPVPPTTLSISASRGNGNGHTFAEWKFSASSGAPLAECNWDFGDGFGASAASCSQGHIYYRDVNGETRLTHTYTVRLSASRVDGKSELSATRDIVVQFEP